MNIEYAIKRNPKVFNHPVVRMYKLLKLVAEPLPADEADPLLVIEPRFSQRTLDVATVSYNGVEIGAERTYYGKPFKFEDGQLKANLPVKEYWSERVWSDRSHAVRAAKKFNGTVMDCFYCDPDRPLWFVCFDEPMKLVELENFYAVNKQQ